MIRIPSYIIISILTGYLCYLFVPIVIKYCKDHNLYDMPGPRKMHSNPTPRLGGVAFFAAYFIGLIPGFLLFPDIWWTNIKTIIGIFCGGSIIFVLGLVDDIHGVKPLWKLFWQIVACLILVAFDIRLQIINVPFYHLVDFGYWGIPLTVIWLVLLFNTINLIDGLDGLASGVSAIVGGSFLIMSLLMGLPLPSFLAAGIIGITAAFLKYNYFPAKIFMGDSGSLFLGYMFGVISLFWPKSFATVVMFVPIVALGVPLIEIITTFLRRSLSGKKFYIADRKHIFHFLLDMGIPPRITVWIFYLASIQLAITTFAIAGGEKNILFVLQLLLIIFTAIVISKNLKLVNKK